jgi:hypothetical protein
MRVPKPLQFLYLALKSLDGCIIVGQVGTKQFDRNSGSGVQHQTFKHHSHAPFTY